MVTIKSFLVILLVGFMCGCGSAVDSGKSGETDGNTGTLSAEVGIGTLTLAWDPSSGADGYKLYHGRASGNYTETIDVKNVETYSLSKLPSAEYYLAVTAYNSFGESTYSNEVFADIP